MGTPDTERMLYSVSEFCRRNSIGKTTFFALVKSGAVATVKVGSRTLVPANSERAWRDTLTGNPGSTPDLVAVRRAPRRTAANGVFR